MSGCALGQRSASASIARLFPEQLLVHHEPNCNIWIVDQNIRRTGEITRRVFYPIGNISNFLQTLALELVQGRYEPDNRRMMEKSYRLCVDIFRSALNCRA